MKKIKYFLNIRKLPFRFLLLLFSVGSGIGLVWVGADKIYYFFDSILAIEIKSNYSFIALLLPGYFNFSYSLVFPHLRC